MHLKSLFLSMVAVSAAAPSGFFNHAYDFSNDLQGFFSKVSHYIDDVKNDPGFLSCDASKIKLPAFASGLTSPDGLTPMYVGLGRGTQNYTCANATSQAKPKAVGAVANLYNATCLAANWPEIMAKLPDLAYKIPLPSGNGPFPPANIDLMGHHFFFDATTPEFNLNLAALNKWNGIAMTKKEGQIDAPANATKGDHGAVPWLYLTTTKGTQGKYKSVYRVDTVSGSPPDTCDGVKSLEFEIQYAANYYFFGK